MFQRSERALFEFASNLGYWPTQKEWNEYAVKHGYMTATNLLFVWGEDWRKQKKAMGITPVLSNEDCLKAVSDAISVLGLYFTRNEYQEWRVQNRPDLPTLRQIDFRFGSLRKAKNQATKHLLK